MKAEDIIKRLIDEKLINGEEALILMKELNKEPRIITTSVPYPITIPDGNWWDNGIRYSNPTCQPSTKYTTHTTSNIND